jgi:hypothetical protein
MNNKEQRLREMLDYLQDKKSSGMSEELKNDSIIQKETPQVAEVKENTEAKVTKIKNQQVVEEDEDDIL